MADGLLFGVAGWSYDDWKDVVYPRGCKDTLRAVAERVDLVEINSTFYGIPSSKNCASWARRTEELGTRFTAKLPHQFTHARRFDDALVREVCDGFGPLAESGRLEGLLAQFNHELRFEPASVDLVGRLAAAFSATAPLFVEVRHRSWNADHALAALAVDASKLPTGVDASRRERHLSPDAFRAAFGVGATAFGAWPKWRQALAKRKVGLY